MTTQEIADRLVALCRIGQFDTVVQELYSPDIVSVEAIAMPGSEREVKGLEAVMAKGQSWTDNHEAHGAEIEGPLVAGGHFAVTFKVDVTFKPEARRMTKEEIAVYQCKDGKIVREEFFYGM